MRRCPKVKAFCHGPLWTPELDRVQSPKEDEWHWKAALNANTLALERHFSLDDAFLFDAKRPYLHEVLRHVIIILMSVMDYMLSLNVKVFSFSF